MSTFDAFVDDATALLPAPLGPGSPVGLPEATGAFDTRSDPHQESFVLADTAVPLVRGFGGPLAVVVTGGAGQVAGPAGLCARLGLPLARLQVALRDPGDLPGNARRVVAAVDDARAGGALDDATEVHVAMPPDGSGAGSGSGASPGWLAAADEVAAAELRLCLPLGLPLGADGAAAPVGTVLSWIDAALDRETPFTAIGLTRSLPGPRTHGFLNVLVATGLLFDGLPDPDGALQETSAAALLDRGVDLARARRWFTSFASHDVEASLLDLAAPDLRGTA